MGGDLGEHRAIYVKALRLDITGKARDMRNRKEGRGQTHAWEPIC